MKIKKRNGTYEQLSFDKIRHRLDKLCKDNSLEQLVGIDIDIIAQKVVSCIYDGVTSSELDEEAGRIAISMTENMEYHKLASRIIISNLHKSTKDKFSKVIDMLYKNKDRNGNNSPIIADDIYEIVKKNKNELDNEIQYTRDYNFDYFGYKTLEKGYLLRIDGKIVERPQHLYMRVAVGIHKDDLESVKKTYKLLSQHFYTQASPTMFNAGTRLANLSSCFLLGTTDSIDGIYKTITDCAKISKVGGGIGVHISNVRGKGSVIRGTNGESDGIIPMLKVYNSTAIYVNQCFTPDTIVYAIDGFKRMDEITEDDFLVTRDGSFRKVNKVMVNHKSEKLLKISHSSSVDSLKCTIQHHLFIMKSVNDEPEFMEASNVKQGYFMGYPIPKYTCIIDDMTDDQYKLYGIMIACGNIRKTQMSLVYKIEMAVYNEFVIKFLEKMNIKFWVNMTDICFDYNTSSIEKTGISYDMLYSENGKKRIHPKILNIPNEKASLVLKGIYETNGYNTSDNFFITILQKELVYSIKYLFLKLGILVDTHTIRNIRNTVSFYQIDIPKVKTLFDTGIITQPFDYIEPTYTRKDDILYKKIDKIEMFEYTGKVYDFNMIDNHNYLTDSGLVHNSGKRKGSFACYIEPYHPDIMEFMDLKKNQGHDDIRARDLFFAIWMPDLFMKQVEQDKEWYLMCPDECPGLNEKYGQEFEDLYWYYVTTKKYKKIIKAQDLWKKILDSQIETGVPYIGYKDAVNKKCNQKNLGTIKSSNLCLEISLYSDDKEYATCNLASLALPKFVEYSPNGKPFFNHDKLCEIAQYIIKPMNKVIDNNYYPTPETKKSNMAHRPLGIGVQGLADVYCKMRLPFESEAAKQLNIEIFETLYYGCLKGSIELAKSDGVYDSFKNSPFSQGKLQFDLVKEFDGIDIDKYLSGRWNWSELKQDLITYGTRNSMLIALMPTASSAQIMNNSECFEAIDSCIFKRRVLSGEYMIVNKYLVKELEKLGLWSKELKDTIIANNGSIQDISVIPNDIKEIYKTVWEISMKSVIEQCRDRGVFVDQMQSMNLFMSNPTYKKMTSMHFYAWRNNLKSGMYYLRSKNSACAGKFSIDVNLEQKLRNQQLLCSIENKDDCTMCSS